MLDRFRRLFSSSSPLSDEARAFIEKLAPSYIWILAIGIRGPSETSVNYGPGNWEAIADRHIELADVDDDDSVVPFNYRRGGRQMLPFFSSEECARHYLATKSWGNSSVGFQPYRLLAGFVTAPGNETFDLILDPGLPSERRLHPAEKELLRKLTTPA